MHGLNRVVKCAFRAGIPGRSSAEAPNASSRRSPPAGLSFGSAWSLGSTNKRPLGGNGWSS